MLRSSPSNTCPHLSCWG